MYNLYYLSFLCPPCHGHIKGVCVPKCEESTKDHEEVQEVLLHGIQHVHTRHQRVAIIASSEKPSIIFQYPPLSNIDPTSVTHK